MALFCTEFINGATGKIHVGPDIIAESWDAAVKIAGCLSIGDQPVKVYGVVADRFLVSENTAECRAAGLAVLDEVSRLIGGKP